MTVDIDLLRELIHRRNERLDELWPFEDRYDRAARNATAWANDAESWRKKSAETAGMAKRSGNRAKRKANIIDALKARSHRKASKAEATKIKNKKKEVLKRGGNIW